MSDRPTRLLLIDDEEELVNYLSKRFKMKGLDVQGANSGPAALELAQQSTFDVAVLDLKMPEMDGLEVLGALKEEQPFLQVIMLTGHGSIDSALESGRRDAFKFLSKPYEFEKLLEVVGEAHAERRRFLHERFQEELEDMVAQSLSPREIMDETQRLRRLYEQ